MVSSMTRLVKIPPAMGAAILFITLAPCPIKTEKFIGQKTKIPFTCKSVRCREGDQKTMKTFLIYNSFFSVSDADRFFYI